jgi:hypothetical protein
MYERNKLKEETERRITIGRTNKVNAKGIRDKKGKAIKVQKEQSKGRERVRDKDIK